VVISLRFSTGRSSESLFQDLILQAERCCIWEKGIWSCGQDVSAFHRRTPDLSVSADAVEAASKEVGKKSAIRDT
jgi:hypothetical protein